jgi:hypothetical protein
MEDSGPIHVPVTSLLGETFIGQKAVCSHTAILDGLDNRKFSVAAKNPAKLSRSTSP